MAVTDALLSLQFGPEFPDPEWADRCQSLKPPRIDGAPLATEWLLGRHPAAHVRFDVSDISNRHAVIAYHPDSDAWSITDVNSKNGTFLRGRKLPVGDPFPLSVGDVFWLGKNRIIVADGEHDTFPNNYGNNPLSKEDSSAAIAISPGVCTPPEELPSDIPAAPTSDVQAAINWVRSLPYWLQVLLIFVVAFIAVLWIIHR